MVLRKQPPPSLEYLAKGNGHSEPPSTSTTSPTKSTSPVSPKRLTRPRRTRSSPQPRQIPSQAPLTGPVFSPDLNTSPAFDLMPIEQAQRSPPGSSPSEPQNPWADDWVDIPNQGQGHDVGPTTAPAQETSLDDKMGNRVPPIVVAGTQRRMAANEWQQAPETNDSSEWDTSEPQPVPLQSNNPFLKARQSDPNPWESGQGLDGDDIHNLRATSFLQSEGSDRSSQNEGFIPMTARLSLLDQQESESPWAGERPRSNLQPTDMRRTQQPDQHRISRDSQSSNLGQVPMGIYLGDGQPNDQHGDQRLPAVTFEASQPTSSEGQYSYAPQADQQHLDRGKLNFDNGAITPPASESNGTTGSSHVLIDVDGPADNKADMKGLNESQAATQSVTSDGELSIPQPGMAVGSTARPVSEQSTSEADARRQNEQRSETYSIRHVNWTDFTGNLRKSPVLVQNQNGPCPLLALVNALALRAPKDTQPPIVKALQTREQISLGLLIEALFDELTTSLGDEQLPDIEALSQFLTMLHTGMNVNPRLTLESDDAVGSFLQTSDIRLYGTFGIPLVHGWVASPSSQTHESLNRVGQYHEDVQLLHFRKEELEDRVFRGGALSPEEEQVMSDIQLIQQFVSVDNATQLSTFGLDRLAEKLAPGSVSILFRNDHFSTLYKHPQSHQLFTMVTDAGYSGHAEVVWECLVDVSGSRAGFYSGDFRPVGHTPGGSDLAGPRTTSSGASNSNIPGEGTKTTMPSQEQNDADYAYALQLQFDEEQRDHRDHRDHSRRASAPYPSRWQADGGNTTHGRSSSVLNPSSNRGVRGSTTGRRGLSQSQLGRPGHTNDNPEDGPPPPYHQAADSPAYTPPPERSQFTDFSQEDRYMRNPPGRRAGAPVSPLPERPRDRSSKDCTVM